MRSLRCLSVLLAAGLVALTLLPAPIASGAPVPNGSGGAPTARKLLFAEEGNGTAGAMADPAKWYYETGAHGWGNAELQAYQRSASNASYDGQGNLTITARQEAGPDGAQYTSARLTTRRSTTPFTFRSGRIEARIKVPAGQGIWPAFWTLGDYNRHGWPGCGEIDVVETINQPEFARGHVHTPTTHDGFNSPADPSGSLANGFHVYAAEWDSTSVTWFLDGVAYGRYVTPTSWVLDGSRPQALILNIAVGGNWPGAPDATTVFPATMLIDYVRVYR